MATLHQTTITSIDEHIDGRTLRRTRNRTAVIMALLDIIREGDLHPGAAEIADRAGVSHRSIFRYFEDLDDLVRTSISHGFVDARPLSEIPDLGVGSLDERVARFVEVRLALYDYVDSMMQLARMRAPMIPAIDEGIAAIAEEFREQIALHFEKELVGVRDDDQPLLVDGILVLTSYDSFTIHTRLLHSDVDRIRTAWTCAVAAMLS